jgi:hypothetical protein
MGKYKLLLGMVLGTVASLCSGMVLPPPDLGNPQTIVDITNKTTKDYRLFLASDIEEHKLLKAGQSTRIDLSKEWKKHSQTSKIILFYILDNNNNVKLSAKFKLFNGALIVELNGRIELMESFSPPASFLINLSLRGANLEETIPEVVVIKH